MEQSVVELLRASLGDDKVSTNTHILKERRHDYWVLSQLEDMEGRGAPNPSCVAMPADTGDVVIIVNACRETGTPLVPFGLGSGVCGGVKVTSDAVLLDMSTMNRTRTIDVHNLIATFDAGVRGADAEAAVAKHGLTLCHYPQSIDLSTVGGWVTTRSSGQFSSAYGSIEEMVFGLEVVLPNGEILELWNADVIAEAILLEKGVRPKKAEDEEYEAYLEMMMDQVWESKEHVLDCAWGSYPEKTLLTTEQWWIEAPATTTRPGLQVMKLKFNQVRKGKAHFDVILSAMAGDDSMDGGDFFGSINSKIDSFAQGKMEMDVSTGLIAQATVSGDIRMEAQIEDRLWDVQYEKNMEGKISQSLRQIP